MQASAEAAATATDQGVSQNQEQSGSEHVQPSESPSIGQASMHSGQHSSQHFEGGEEQAVAQLELGIESTDDVSRHDRSRLRETPKDYRWGRDV